MNEKSKNKKKNSWYGRMKRKINAAHRYGIKKVIIPKGNLKDLEEVPSEVKKDIEYVNVSNVEEAISML